MSSLDPFVESFRGWAYRSDYPELRTVWNLRGKEVSRVEIFVLISEGKIRFHENAIMKITGREAHARRRMGDNPSVNAVHATTLPSTTPAVT